MLVTPASDNGYVVEELVRGFREMAEGRGEVIVVRQAPAALDVLLVAAAPTGSPIYVRVVEDECYIRYGSGTTDPSAWGAPGDEAFVLELVQAIIDGDAWESAFVDADSVDEGRVEFSSHIEAASITTHGGPEDGFIFTRRVPPWPSAVE